jgi:hypothetical protein
MLTAAQLQALKSDLAANFPTLQDEEAAAQYNVPANPDYWVWRSFVPDSEIYAATSPDSTTWSWTIFIGRSQGERDAWRQMVNMAGGLNPSLANVRAGVADIFSGAGGVNQRAYLLSVGRRKSTRGEKLFATATAGGAGQRGSTANPDTMGFEGLITAADVSQARNA